jgi:toxin-antitoxin system PIN domain toxin
VIAVDTNILVYAHRADSSWHSPANRCLRRLAESGDEWLIPWPCIHEFMAVATNPRIFARPSTTAEAVHQVDLWQQSPGLRIRAESPAHWATLRELALPSRLSGARFHDARIAAICIDQQVERLWTADRDFSRFPAVRSENPLVFA